MWRCLRRGTFLATLLLLTSVPAFADTFTLAGTLSFFDPTFNRPNVGNPPTSTAGPIQYDAFAFTVNASGSYTLALGTNDGDHDPFLVLYRDSFNPASPLANVIIADNNSGGSGSAFVTVNLAAERIYFAILTSNSSIEFGPYRLVINGPGVATAAAAPVPEPATVLLLGTGLAAAVAGARGRRKGRKGGAP